MSQVSLKFLYIAMCAHAKQLLHFQVGMISAMRITPLPISDNNIWKLTLVERIIPLKHSHSIFTSLSALDLVFCMHVGAKGRSKMSSITKTCIIFHNEMILHRKYLQLSQLFLFCWVLVWGFLKVLFQFVGWFVDFGFVFIFHCRHCRKKRLPKFYCNNFFHCITE